MVEIIPFGKYQGKSVEQVALEDPSYFYSHLLRIEIRKRSLLERLNFVNHVANNFVSVIACNNEGCNNPAELISIYCNPHMNVRQSDSGFVYCSSDCFSNDSRADHGPKISLNRLGLRTALSPVDRDTKRLAKVISQCMGLKEGRKTKEYLEDFFNQCRLRVPYSG